MADASAAEPGRARALVAVAAASAFLAPLAVYLPTPGDYWIRVDNETLIRRAESVRFLTLPREERAGALVEIFGTAHGDLYQPLLVVSLAVDYALFGWDRAGFHAHSLGLHLLNAVGLFALALRLIAGRGGARDGITTGAVGAALLATWLATLHPTAVEAVSWIIHRTLLVTALFAIAGAHAYLSYARDPRRVGWLVAATVAFVLSSMAKALPSLVVVPFLIDAWVHRPPSWRWLWEKLPLLAAAGFLAVLNLHFSSAMAEDVASEVDWLTVARTVPDAFLLSAANTLVPDRLALIYPPGDVAAVLGWRWLIVGVAAVGVGLAGVRLWRRGERGLLLGVAGGLALLAPSIAASAFRYSITADRYGYVPMLMLAPGLAAGLMGLRHLPRSAARGALVIAVAWTLLIGSKAREQARLWSDETRLWEAVIENGPHPVAYGALGRAYGARGEYAAALEALDRATELLATDHADLDGPIYHLNRERFALAAAQEAGDGPDAPERRARLLAVAAESAGRGAARWPEVADFHFDLGRAHRERGEAAAAEAAFERAVSVDPRHRYALVAWGQSLAARGEYESAAELLWRALRVDRNHVPALASLSEVLLEQANHLDAARVAFFWCQRSPAAAEAHARFLDVIERGAAAGRADALRPWVERYAARFPGTQPVQRWLERAGAGRVPEDPTASPDPA